MALGIKTFSTKKTSLTPIAENGITDEELENTLTEVNKTKKDGYDTSNDSLNKAELTDFIMIMGGGTLFTKEEAQALATWLLDGKNQISIDAIMTKLGGTDGDNVISADEMILLGDVFAPSLIKNTALTEDNLDYLYNIFDADGNLNITELKGLIGVIDTPGNVEKLEMVLRALGVSENAIKGIKSGLTSGDPYIKRAMVDFLKNFLEHDHDDVFDNNDTFVAEMEKVKNFNITNIEEIGKTAIATETPLKDAKNPSRDWKSTSLTEKEFTTAISTNGKIDKDKFAYVLVQMGLANDKETADTIAENIIKLNGGNDVTAAELFKNMAGTNTTQLTADEIIASAFISQNNEVDISAFKAMLNASSDKSKVIDALYNAIGVTPPTGKTSAELAKQSTNNIVKAVFGDINGADIVTAQSVKDFVEGRTQTGATASESKVDGDGNVILSNGIIENKKFQESITDQDGTKIDSDKLTTTLKLLGLDEKYIPDMVAAWAKLTPEALTKKLTAGTGITKDSVILESAFINYDKDNKVIDDKDDRKTINQHAVYNALEQYADNPDGKKQFLNSLLDKMDVPSSERDKFVDHLLTLEDAKVSETETVNKNARIVLTLAGYTNEGKKITVTGNQYTIAGQSTDRASMTIDKKSIDEAIGIANESIKPETTTTPVTTTTTTPTTAAKAAKATTTTDTTAKATTDTTATPTTPTTATTPTDTTATPTTPTTATTPTDTTATTPTAPTTAPDDGPIEKNNHGNFKAKLNYVIGAFSKIFIGQEIKDGTKIVKMPNASDTKEKISVENDGYLTEKTGISWYEIFNRLASMTKFDIDQFLDPNKTIEQKLDFLKKNIRKEKFFVNDNKDNYVENRDEYLKKTT